MHLDADLELPPGYSDASFLGRGGFSVVWGAHQAQFDRDVALKVLTVDLTGADLRRFERECAAMGRLSSHPNVVTVYESGLTPRGRAFVAMERCAGSYAERLRDHGTVRPSEVTHVAAAVGAALRSAHSRGMIHRDVKPANVLISDYGSPLLADFGLTVRPNLDMSTGLDAYTPAHAAPEVLDRGEITAACDVYSLASTLYTLLVGVPPFALSDGDSLVRFMMRVLNEPAPALPEHVPPRLSDLISAGLEKDPARRPAAAAFAELRAAGEYTQTTVRKVAPDTVAEAFTAADAADAAPEAASELEPTRMRKAVTNAAPTPASTVAAPTTPRQPDGRQPLAAEVHSSPTTAVSRVRVRVAAVALGALVLLLAATAMQLHGKGGRPQAHTSTSRDVSEVAKVQADYQRLSQSSSSKTAAADARAEAANAAAQERTYQVRQDRLRALEASIQHYVDTRDEFAEAVLGVHCDVDDLYAAVVSPVVTCSADTDSQRGYPFKAKMNWTNGTFAFHLAQ